MGKMSQIHAEAQEYVDLDEYDPEFAQQVESVAGERLVLYAKRESLNRAMRVIEYGNDFAYTTQAEELLALQKELTKVETELTKFGAGI